MSKEELLGDIADLKTGPFGTQLHASEYVDEGIPVINVRNIGYGEILSTDIDKISEETRERLFEHILKNNDIVFGRKGSIDKHAFIDKQYEGWVQGSDCIRVRINQEDINPKYVSHYLKLDSVKKQLINGSVGSTMPSMNTDILKTIKIILPDKTQQDKIENVLSTIERKIVNNNAIILDLETIAELLFNYWFVQFNFPDKNGHPYKTSGGKMVWNNQLKCEIPEGWEVKCFGDLVSLTNGINYDKNEIGNKNYHIVNVRDITASSFVLDSSTFDEIELKSSQADRYLINDNDILIARSGTPGATRILLNNDGNTIFCGFIIRCVPFDIKYRLYLAYVLKYLEGSNATKTGGSILQNVSQDTLKQVLISLPDRRTICLFSNVINTYLSTIQNLIEENQQLKSLRDFLLPMLMNGQVKSKLNSR